MKTFAFRAPAAPPVAIAASASTRAVRWRVLALGAASAVLTMAGCAGTPPAPVAPAADTRPPPPPPLPAGPELSAVPDPAGLLVSGRVAKPSATLAVVRDWTGLPMPQSEDVAQLLLDEPVGPVLDLDQPIDFAVAMTGTGTHTHEIAAVSFALGEASTAKSALAQHYKLVPAEGGVTRLDKVHGANGKDEADEDEDERRECEIAPAYGPAAERLVCGLGTKALSALAPWLTRTATRKAPPSDAHVDFRMEPVRALISGQKHMAKSILGSLFDSSAGTGSDQLVTSVTGDLIDFALELDGMTLDMHARSEGADATTTVKFLGRTSAMTRMLTAHPERSGPAPAAFLQMPGDADFGFFERGIDEDQMTRGRDLIMHFVDELFSSSGIKDADRKAVVDALGGLATPAPLCVSGGTDWDVVKKAAEASEKASAGTDANATADAQRQLIEARMGWYVVEIDEASAKAATMIKDLAAAMSRPGLAAKTKDLGSVRSGPLPKGVTLPAGTVHYILDVTKRLVGEDPAKKPAVHKPALVHLYVTGDATHAWMAFGGGESLVASKLAEALGGTGSKLSARPELAPIVSGSVGAGGFFAARELPSGLGPRSIKHLNQWAALPHGGKIGVPFSVTALSDTQASFNLQVPRGAIEDMVALAMRHGL